MNKEIKLTYYNTKPGEENTGMKHVLWEVNDGTNLSHDWGFAVWDGREWEPIEVPEGYTAKVAWWANTCDPAYLVSNIIRLGH